MKMKIRICDKTVTRKKGIEITNIRAIECTGIVNRIFSGMENQNWSLQNVLLYIDPKTKQATVVEMYLKNMKGE